MHDVSTIHASEREQTGNNVTSTVQHSSDVVRLPEQIQFNREICTAKLCEEIVPLLVKHYQEIAHFQDIPLAPDFNQYIQLEQQGALRVYTARVAAGELIGYSVFFVRKNAHYSTSLQALQDVLYIDPERRGFGGKFIPWCDEQLRADGVEVVYHHVKNKHNFGPFLEKLGYEHIECVWGRRL